MPQIVIPQSSLTVNQVKQRKYGVEETDNCNVSIYKLPEVLLMA